MTPQERLLFQMGLITPIPEVWTKKEHYDHTIELVQHPYTSEWEYMFYPTAEGIQHDEDYDGDGFKYCGNCRWSSDLDVVLDLIEEDSPYVSNCCGALPRGNGDNDSMDYGICPDCGEHCEYIMELERDTPNMETSIKDYLKKFKTK